MNNYVKQIFKAIGLQFIVNIEKKDKKADANLLQCSLNSLSQSKLTVTMADRDELQKKLQKSKEQVFDRSSQ